ncbi:MAG: sulfurtransferase-like selenium metabolism protein YedF [Desulfurivibrio sp.]|nr:sulfurtransferase-like selenium metabolism protein YedF [Desulfurivibrio sp.]
MDAENRLQLDCRGLNCPQPVIATGEALQELGRGRLLVRVDNEAARANVERFARGRGCEVAIRPEEGGFCLVIDQESPAAASGAAPAAGEYQCGPGAPLIGVIDAATMGRGDEQLGRVLMHAFIKTLPALAQPPAALYFYNSGVRLTAGPDALVEPLQTLAAAGCQLYSCGTCLDFYQLQSQLQVGEVTDMLAIVNAMAQSGAMLRP